MKKQYALFTIILITGLYSCTCSGTFNCTTLSSSELSWLPANATDTIKFINANGQHIKFFGTSLATSPAYETDDCKSSGLGCQCGQHTCEASGGYSATGDTTIGGQQMYYINVKVQSPQDFSHVYYSIFDFLNGGIDMLKPTSLLVGDSLIQSLQLGTHTYNTVYVQRIDTTLSNNANKKVWKTYFTQADGIIGFRTRQAQSLYYRE